MIAGLIFAIVYCVFTLTTAIIADVYIIKRDKKNFSEALDVISYNWTTGLCWPFTLPFLLKEIISEKCGTSALDNKTDNKEREI